MLYKTVQFACVAGAVAFSPSVSSSKVASSKVARSTGVEMAKKSVRAPTPTTLLASFAPPTSTSTPCRARQPERTSPLDLSRAPRRTTLPTLLNPICLV